jgi:hypothetical protein
MSVWRSVLVVLASVTVSSIAAAQTTVSMGVGQGGSPHEKTTWTVNGATISIAYGRPYLKGRPESKMMPAGQPWRTGADEATVLTTDKPLTFGSVHLRPGSYTINTEPGEKTWQLLLGKLGAPDQWGIPYLPNLEIGRAPMTVSKASAPAEQVTISIDAKQPALHVAWGTTVATIPFKVGGGS